MDERSLRLQLIASTIINVVLIVVIFGFGFASYQYLNGDDEIAGMYYTPVERLWVEPTGSYSFTLDFVQHELGHHMWKHLNESEKNRWRDVYNSSDSRIREYANTSAEEGFASHVNFLTQCELREETVFSRDDRKERVAFELAQETRRFK